jgi:ABC-2 type transport system permease protein
MTTPTTTTITSTVTSVARARDRRPNALREGWLIAGRDMLHWVREPWGIIFGLAFNIMLILLFGFLFGGAIDVPGGGDYIAFLLPGMFALTMLFGLETTMTAMAEDAKRGITDRFRSLPIASASVALGRAIADLASSALSLAVLMLGGLLIGWRPTTGPAEIALGIVLLLWLRFAMLWLGIFLGLRFSGPGATTAVQVLVWPVGFLSTVFVSAETMPGWLGTVAEWNPVSATAAAARELFGNPTGTTSGWLAENAVLAASVWPLVLTAVFLPLATAAYRRLRR